MKKNNSTKATVILVIFIVGFLVSYPFNYNFWGGLAASACSASVIGGLADWFAVTAIFRKPLGLNWPGKIFRTEIIPKNRNKIVDALVDIIENELMSRESIRNKILELDFSNIIIRHFENETSRDEVKRLLAMALSDAINNIDPVKIGKIIDETVRYGAEGFDISPVLSCMLEYIRKDENEEKILDLIIYSAKDIIKNENVHGLLTEFVEKVIKEYENGISSRVITNRVLLNVVIKKSPSDIASMVEDKIIEAVYSVRNIGNNGRITLDRTIDVFIMSLKNDMSVSTKINDMKNSMIKAVPSLDKKLGTFIEKFREDYLAGNKKSEFIGFIDKSLETIFKDFIENHMLQRAVDAYIKKMAINFAESRHKQIGIIVKDKINQFTTEELVNLIENSAGNDLQMIRINGSIVGGMVGVITYLLSYLIR